MPRLLAVMTLLLFFSTGQAHAEQPPQLHPLYTAIAQCDATVTETALLEAEINTYDPAIDGLSPFYLAVTKAIVDPVPEREQACRKIVERMIAAGAAIDAPGREGDMLTTLHSALLLATLHSRYDVAELLIAASTELNTPLNNAGDTPLIRAIKYQDPTLVAILLKHGARPMKRDADGLLPYEHVLSGEDAKRSPILAVMGVERTQEDRERVIELLSNPPEPEAG